MSADRWQTLDRLFIEALQLPAEARAALLARECGTDEQLRREVLSLLTAVESSGTFLERPAFERLARAMAADGWSLRQGERLGTYTVRDLLGAGAVGEVWRATDERLNRDVAIKLLLPHLSSDPQRARRFAEEARTAGSLNHPNILSVYDVGEHGGVPFIVSEYVDGESLRMRLKRGPLSIDVAAAVALQMARGLSAAHARGIIHCDLKPDNVFIRADGGVKILDFGLARLKTAPATLSDLPDVTVSSLAGTAGYIAPEQVLGQEADVRSDLFALGVTMFEMLSGARPFKGDSVVETLNATLMLAPADLRAARPDVPASLSRIVMRLLEKAPESRFQSAEELVQAFEEATTAANASSRRALPILIAAAVVTTLIVAAALMLPTAPRTISDVSTTSIAAYDLYTRGLDASVNVRWPEAVTWLEQAIAIDPAFAEAHLRLASAYEGLGQIAARDRALGNASAHAAKLSERHRLLLAVALEADPRGDPSRRAQLLDELLTRFPDVEEAYPVAFGLYHPVSGVFPNLEKLLTIARTGATVLPASPQTRNRYAFALTEAGRLRKRSANSRSMHGSRPVSRIPSTASAASTCRWARPPKPSSRIPERWPSIPAFRQAAGSRTHSACWDGTRRRLPPSRRLCMCTRSWCLARAAMRRRSASCGADWRGRRTTTTCSSRPASISRRQYCHSSERITRRCSARSRRSATRCPPSLPDSRDTGRSSQIRWAAWRILAWVVRAGPRRLPIRRLARSGRRTRSSASGTGSCRESWRSRAEMLAGAARAFSAGEIPARRGISLDIPGAVVTNNLILRDGAARAAHARGDLPAAIEIYRRLLANGPDQK